MAEGLIGAAIAAEADQSHPLVVEKARVYGFF
jgi:hypothetical protein